VSEHTDGGLLFGNRAAVDASMARGGTVRYASATWSADRAADTTAACSGGDDSPLADRADDADTAGVPVVAGPDD
jgi:hypothetical protein